MKIVIATAVYYPMINGVAVFSHNLALGLAKRGHEVLVLTPSQTGKSHVVMEDGVRTEFLRSASLNMYPDQIHQVPEKKKIFGKALPHLFYKNGFKVSVFPRGEIKEILDKFDPDVVHVQVSDPIGLSVVSYARKRGIPIVTTEHNQPEVLTEPMHMAKVFEKPTNAILSAYFKNRQSKSDFVTMPTKQAIENLLGNEKDFPVPVEAVSNGVDLTHFKPGEADEDTFRRHGLEFDAPTVLYVGRVDPEKQVGKIAEAFLLATKEVPEAQLVVVGDGVDRAKLVAEYGDNKKIHFLGRIVPPELYDLYQVGDVFATASEIETQGIVLIEAAAVGLPLIAVNKGAVNEVCIDGENGFLCEPGNIKEISEAMVKILSDKKLQEKFSKRSIEIAKEHDFERTCDQFIQIHHRLSEK